MMGRSIISATFSARVMDNAQVRSIDADTRAHDQSHDQGALLPTIGKS